MKEAPGGHVQEDQYVVAKAMETLAADPRVGETSLHVSVTGNRLFVTGDVATQERREAISRVLQEKFPDCEIANATSVYEMIETTEEEHL